MSDSQINWLKRVLIILMFLGFDLVLGYLFWSQTKSNLHPVAINWLEKAGIKIPQVLLQSPLPKQSSVNPTQVLELVNKIRAEKNLKPLMENSKLATAAAELQQAFAKDEYKIDTVSFDPELKIALEQNHYNYKAVGDVAVIGPASADEVVRTWRENPQQFATLIDTSYTEVGTFSEQITYEGEKVWLTILVLAQPETTKVVPTQKKVQQYTPAPEISDSDIVQALNLYRSDHQVHQLVVDNNLCTYAEKRVQDLIAFGGLDNHQGFKADFANNEQIPESIKAYSGGAIGENLASQYCINGTTNQKFTATTATALIEWCFDSSVKGHREAQLNTRYNAVCSRHGQNMYVIIFGE